MVIPK